MGFLTARQAFSLYGNANPFVSPAALRESNYSANANGTLLRLLDWRQPSTQARLAENALRAFIRSSAFSCVAGKAAIASGGYRFGYYRKFGEMSSTEGLARDLAAFVAERPFMSSTYTTFVAVFDGPVHGNESGFEAALWRELQRLAELAAPHYSWSARVSSDAQAPDFAFSFAGEAFFVVGMHPASSRLSRRFFLPALAFNSHRQFVDARTTGRFGRLQKLTRERELQLQGTLNPELCEFGEHTEARQYSGRQTGEGWRCPFRAPS